MFRGYQQHDTQEFLRCFMDQLHDELKEQVTEVSPHPRLGSSSKNIFAINSFHLIKDKLV